MSIDILSRLNTAGHKTQISTLVIFANSYTGKLLGLFSAVDYSMSMLNTYFTLNPTYSPNIKPLVHEIVYPKPVTYSSIS